MAGRNMKGKNNPMYGKFHTLETKEKMSKIHRGAQHSDEKNPNWKGDKVKYRGLHRWINRKLGKAKKCEFCGLKKLPEGKKRYFEWANINGRYKRDIADWITLCVSCHRKYDRFIRKIRRKSLREEVKI